jgi:hypothetical protein
MADEVKQAEGGVVPDELAFHYLKSTLFRVVHVDGLIGSITPQGLLHIAMFNERPAIPQYVLHSISGDGKLGPERAHSGKEGIVRELEVDLLMSEKIARSLHEWLGARLQEFEILHGLAQPSLERKPE